jgi:Holliday junction resolvase
MNFEDIKGIEDLEIVSEGIIWQNFERLAAFIFEKNDFQVKINTVKTFSKKRRQYDVIAKRGNQTFLIECKKWAGNRYRLSALKRAIEQHKERTAFYKNITEEDAVPIIVTLIEEEIQFYEGVPIVPIQKLNSFINELDEYENERSFGDSEDNMHFPDDTPTSFHETSSSND